MRLISLTLNPDRLKIEIEIRWTSPEKLKTKVEIVESGTYEKNIKLDPSSFKH